MKSLRERIEDCVFCDLDKVKGWQVVADGVIMFEPLNPVVKGHRLFVPIEHVDDATVKPELTARVMEAAADYAGDHSASNIITSIGHNATQSVFHLHIHVVPRRLNDGLQLPWSPSLHSELQRIRDSLPEKKKLEVEQPRLYQGVGGGSAPFYCSGCQMGETDIMDNYDEQDGRYYCRCSFWDTPHNAFLDRSGGNWLGWKNKQAAQDCLNSLPIEENGFNEAIGQVREIIDKELK